LDETSVHRESSRSRPTSLERKVGGHSFTTNLPKGGGIVVKAGRNDKAEVEQGPKRIGKGGFRGEGFRTNSRGAQEKTDGALSKRTDTRMAT